MTQSYQVKSFGNSIQRAHGALDHKTASVFFQGDYEFVPGWSVSGGLRYSWEEKEAQSANTPNCDLDFNCVFNFTDSDSWSNLSPKLGVDWQVHDNVLALVSWTKGFRSGAVATIPTHRLCQ